MTQQELADAAGVDLKTVYNLESGTRWPIARTRVLISAALGWHGDALTALAGGQPPADVAGPAPAPDAHADSSGIPISEEEREAAQPIADDIHDLLLAAAIRTGNPDPPGDEVFERGSWDAQTWDRLRRQFPSTRRRLWVIALAAVPDAGQPSRRHGAAAGLTPQAALSRSTGGG